MTLNAANIIQILFAFQATFFGLISMPQPRLRSLALLLFAFALHMGLNLMAETGNLGHFPNITSAFGFAYGPLIYLFVRDICQADPKLTRADLPHALPFLIALPFSPSSLTFDIIGFTSISAYFFATYRYIQRYNFSIAASVPQEEEARLSWVRNTFLGLVLLTLYDASRIFLSYRYPRFEGEVYYLITLVGAFLAINWMIMKAFQFRASFSGLTEGEFLPRDAQAANTPALTVSEIKDVEIAIRMLEKDRLYLNPNLRLEAFAAAAGLEARHLSSLIHRHLGIRFPTLVNGLRVEHAKSLIRETASGSCNFLAISYQSGFNSKSSFNLVFKRTTGMTPTAYRQSLQDLG